MQTTRYPVWKRVLWILGIAAYGLAATGLSGVAWRLLPGIFSSIFSGKALDTSLVRALQAFQVVVVVGLWVGLLAVAAWQMTVRGHKTAGCMLADMTDREILMIRGELFLILLIIPFCLIFAIGPWYMNGGLAWLGGPMPASLSMCNCFGSNQCRELIAECYAAQTAAAAPPAWWPWGH